MVVFLFDQLEFQFPTGWNSTKNWKYPIEQKDSFNSQRDGILLDFLAASFIPILSVSIPNGMEFYRTLNLGGERRKSFNSQRDGILLMIFSWALPILDSFNSQRDGILPPTLEIRPGYKLFQFPTGWNSTKGFFLWPIRSSHVSIPNGMEFYSPKEFRCEPISLVSIPNGMEFYHIRYFTEHALEEFQFPTGWNSTTAILDRFLTILSFNSQRDGILRWACKAFRAFHAVSIPNGMEFYAGVLTTKFNQFLFQFPTGWNSTARILPFFYVESVKSIYFYALKWTKFKKASIVQCPKFRHFRILKATLSLSICIVSANVKI